MPSLAATMPEGRLVFAEMPLGDLGAAAFDAMPVEAILVDPTGSVRHVNRAWRDFARANGGADDLYVGHNYFTMLSHVGPPLDNLAATIAQGLRAVLTGRSEQFISPDHRCHRPLLTGDVGHAAVASPDVADDGAAAAAADDDQALAEQRWFRLVIRPLVVSGGGGGASRWAMLVYENVSPAHMQARLGRREMPASAGAATERQAAGRLAPFADEAPHHVGPRASATDAMTAAAAMQWPVQNAAFLQAILDDIADMVVTIDENGLIRSFNRAAEAAFGYAAASVLGGNVSLLMGDSDAAQHDGYLQHYRRNGQPRILGLTRQVQARRSDGEAFWVDLRTTECWFDGHRLFVATMRDMSERRRMEADLRHAKQAAEASNRAKSDFLARMSHELRTPLNSILGFAEVIKGQLFGPDPARYADYSQHIYDSGSWLLGLINDILDLSKIEAGRLELQMARLAPMPLIAAAVDIVSAQFARRNVSLVLDLPPGLPVIDIDARAFQQILINLLSNAVKFTPPGGQVRISSRVQPARTTTEDGLAGNELLLMISDTGIGIAPDRLSRVMEPFGHSDHGLITGLDSLASATETGGAQASVTDLAPGETTAQKGSGLGLSICKRLMELQNGHLGLASELGRGTTVTLRFPLLD
jgi:PAS domain S-box-containing protein